MDVYETRAMLIYDLLLARYGEIPLQPRRPPMVELIMTILSQRTTAKNERMAFERLWSRYGSWEAIREAPVDDVADAISPSNYPETKAPRIKEVLARIIEDRGEPSIDFLADETIEDGLKYLTNLPGVGIKTASLVLLFCFGKPVMPVDTHVLRISKRLGLLDEKLSAEKAHTEILKLLPNDPHVLYNFHVAMLKHGRTLCTYANPKCAPCPLKAYCKWYAENRVE